MSKYDYAKQYQEEQKRIREKIREEENPHHKRHIAEFDEMMEAKIKARVPMMLEEHERNVQVNVETYLNGKRVRGNADFMKGVRDTVLGAIKKMGKK